MLLCHHKELGFPYKLRSVILAPLFKKAMEELNKLMVRIITSVDKLQ